MECELCLSTVESLQQVELHGSYFWICNGCAEANADQIKRAAAEDMDGADAAEADQEEM